MGNRAHVDRYRAVASDIEAVASPEGMQVAVKDQTDQLALPIQHGGARISADDVLIGDEVERRVQFELVPVGMPARR